MKSERNKGRALELYNSYPEGTADIRVVAQWLTRVAVFLLARYINDD